MKVWMHHKWGKKEFRGSYSKSPKGQRILNLFWENPKNPKNFLELTYDTPSAAKKAGWVYKK